MFNDIFSLLVLSSLFNILCSLIGGNSEVLGVSFRTAQLPLIVLGIINFPISGLVSASFCKVAGYESNYGFHSSLNIVPSQ